MTDDLEKKLLAGSAYRIFHEELTKHLAATKTLFENREWSEEKLKEAAGRFHTIRGGAGFFKLTLLGQLAGQLEDLLDDTPFAELPQKIGELQALNARLHHEASLAPPPTPAP